MNGKHERAATLAFVALCVFAFSVVTTSSASAACRQVATGEPSTFKTRSAAGVCEGSKALEGFAETQGTGVEVTPGVYCYKVAHATEPSSWEDSKCTKAKSGKGEFIKVDSDCILGGGGSLQYTAQVSVWIPDSELCVLYEGGGLKAFGVGGVETPASSGYSFIGTDEAPSGSFKSGQLKEMEEAAKGTSGKEQDLVFPVIQASIAIIVNTPKGCTLTSISNEDLQKAWAGETTKWSQITGASPKAECEKGITRVVRKDGSSATSQFKHYLFEINEKKLKGTTKTKSGKTVAERTWAELQPEEEANLEWPEEAGILSPVFHALNQGGGGETEEVLKEEQGTKEGTIGYAVLADAREKYNGESGNQYHWLAVENEALSPVKAVEPGTDATEPSTKTAESNCEETAYTGTIPAAGFDKDWSGVYGGNPGNRGRKGKSKHYPICTLAWDVALGGYVQAGLTALDGMVTHEYLSEYVVAEKRGQTDIKGHDYSPLPATPVNIAKIARETAAKIAER